MARLVQGKQEVMQAKADVQAQKNNEMSSRMSAVQNDKDQSFQQKMAAAANANEVNANIPRPIIDKATLLALAGEATRSGKLKDQIMPILPPTQHVRVEPVMERQAPPPAQAVAKPVTMETPDQQGARQNLPPASQTMHDNATLLTPDKTIEPVMQNANKGQNRN